MKPTKPTPLFRYKGPDTFPGVPARDLTKEEFERLPTLRQLDVEANASYVRVTPPKAPDTTAGDGKEKK